MLAPSLIQRSDDWVGIATPTFPPLPVAFAASVAASLAVVVTSALASDAGAAVVAVVWEPPQPVSMAAERAVPRMRLRILRFIILPSCGIVLYIQVASLATLHFYLLFQVLLYIELAFMLFCLIYSYM